MKFRRYFLFYFVFYEVIRTFSNAFAICILRDKLTESLLKLPQRQIADEAIPESVCFVNGVGLLFVGWPAQKQRGKLMLFEDNRQSLFEKVQSPLQISDVHKIVDGVYDFLPLFGDFPFQFAVNRAAESVKHLF